jgi:hypothetical protein
MVFHSACVWNTICTTHIGRSEQTDMNSEERSADASKRHVPSVVCGQARLLLEEFSQAVGAATELYREQLKAIVEGDLEANRFDLLVHDANQRKLEAKYAYLAHLDSHGCSPTHDEHPDTGRTRTHS